ncbi:hypothetical protein LPJ57_010779, partial [Coemansia sp. RSA 486]
MSLGLIDFSKVDMGDSLFEIETPPRGSLFTDGSGAGAEADALAMASSDANANANPSADTAADHGVKPDAEMSTHMDLDVDVDMEDANSAISELAVSKEGPDSMSVEHRQENELEQELGPSQQQSQATVVMAEYPSDQQAMAVDSMQALSLDHAIKSNSVSSPLAVPVLADGSKRMDDEDVHLKDRRISNCSSTDAQNHCLTPQRTPRMSPSPKNEARNLSAASMALFVNQMVTPRTQTARYWYGPMDTAFPTAMSRPQVAESPMPAETPQRLSKIDRYLKRLAENDDVDESLFRSLARFAKDESNTSWVSESGGGSGYLDRILSACLRWLQSPAENRDTVFTKDSCFDVLRVLVRRKSRYFSLPTARLLLLEVLRNRFFESTILSGSAED